MSAHPRDPGTVRVGAWERLLRLTPFKLLALVGVWLGAVVMHNLAYALLRDAFGPGWDEPFFFLVAVVLVPAWLVAAVVYSLARPRGRRR